MPISPHTASVILSDSLRGLVLGSTPAGLSQGMFSVYILECVCICLSVFLGHSVSLSSSVSLFLCLSLLSSRLLLSSPPLFCSPPLLISSPPLLYSTLPLYSPSRLNSSLLSSSSHLRAIRVPHMVFPTPVPVPSSAIYCHTIGRFN